MISDLTTRRGVFSKYTPTNIGPRLTFVSVIFLWCPCVEVVQKFLTFKKKLLWLKTMSISTKILLSVPYQSTLRIITNLQCTMQDNLKVLYSRQELMQAYDSYGFV